MGIRLERALDSMERAGSYAAVFPVPGIIPGVLKVAGGVIQLVAAIATAIFFLQGMLLWLA